MTRENHHPTRMAYADHQWCLPPPHPPVSMLGARNWSARRSASIVAVAAAEPYLQTPKTVLPRQGAAMSLAMR